MSNICEKGSVIRLVDHYQVSKGNLYLLHKTGIEKIPLKDIGIVKKQVKDLTLEECRKLCIDYECITNNAFLLIDFDCKHLLMNDYIDITEIVKEQGNV